MKCFDGSAHVGIINKSRLTINYFVFADHANENGFVLSTTNFLLAGASATQILTKIEKQNLLGDADVFGLSEETQRFFAAFSTYAALFHSAERNAEIANKPAIYPDCAGVDSLGDAMVAAQVLRPDARREAVFDVIGVIDYFFFAVEGRDCYDGPENFFAICAA